MESTLTEQTHQVSEAQSRAQPEPIMTSGNSSKVDHRGDHTHHTTDRDNSPPHWVADNPANHTMSYPYPRYNDEADAEAHVCTFLRTWQTSHVSQRLAEQDANASKIAEFGLLLERQATNWYSQHNLTEFRDFQQLRKKFILIFHLRIPLWELMSQFYVVYQEPHETVPQFIIRFQNLQRQLVCPPSAEELKEPFLSAL